MPKRVVPSRGIGQPDYSKEISSGRERPGLTLKYNQSLKIFGIVLSNVPSPYAWVTSPLAAATTVKFIDNETGLDTPYTLSKGYTLSIIEASYSSDEDVELWIYIDGYLYSGAGIISAGTQTLENRILGFSTVILDPTGASTHTLDVTLTNNGTESLTGGFSAATIIEAVGTDPPPTTKTVRCKFCGYEEVVPQETVQWICPKCKKLNIFYNLSRFRGTP